MKLFLASSLSIVGDIITTHTHLQGAKVGCIWNAADADGGKNARWNIQDYNFFISSGAICKDIDLHETNNRSEIWDEIDVVFVGGGDTLYLRDLAESSGLYAAIHDFLGSGGIYMGTSAGSMLPCRDVYYPHSGRDTRGFDIFPLMLIPHRGSPDFLSDRENNIKKMNDHGLSYLLLTDIDVLIIDNNNRTVQRTSRYTLQDVVNKVNQEINNQ